MPRKTFVYGCIHVCGNKSSCSKSLKKKSGLIKFQQAILKNTKSKISFHDGDIIQGIIKK